MPEPRTITLQADQVTQTDDGGFTINLPDSVITEEEAAANFVPRDVHTTLETGVQDRVNSAATNARTKALEDAVLDNAFLDSAIGARAEFFKERFPDAGEVDVEAIRTQFRTEEVVPLQTQVETLTTNIGKLETSTLRGTVEAALTDATVKDDHRELMRSHVRQSVRWDGELQREVVVDAKGDVLRKVSDGENKPITAAQFVMDLRNGGKFDMAFADTTRVGGGLDGVTPTPDNIDDLIATAEAAKDRDPALISRLKVQKLQGVPVPGSPK